MSNAESSRRYEYIPFNIYIALSEILKKITPYAISVKGCVKHIPRAPTVAMFMTTLESCEVSKRQEQALSKRLYFNAVTQKESQCCSDISVLCAKLQ